MENKQMKSDEELRAEHYIKEGEYYERKEFFRAAASSFSAASLAYEKAGKIEESISARQKQIELSLKLDID